MRDLDADQEEALANILAMADVADGPWETIERWARFEWTDVERDRLTELARLHADGYEPEEILDLIAEWAIDTIRRERKAMRGETAGEEVWDAD